MNDKEPVNAWRKKVGMNFYLCGFMAAGKTTLLQHLKNMVPQECLDLDEVLLLNSQFDSIDTWFKNNGEYHFRLKEAEVALELMNRKGLILALGGGSLEHPGIYEKAMKSGQLVWLDTPFAKCWERIHISKDRPLKELGQVALLKLYEARKKTYQESQVKLSYPWNDQQIAEVFLS